MRLLMHTYTHTFAQGQIVCVTFNSCKSDIVA